MNLKPSFIITILFGLLCSVFMSSCAEKKAKDDFIEEFDLELKGEVLNLEQNTYGQHLVCLKVLKSNHDDYFPIHDPNKFRSKKLDLWEKAFFVKVKDSLAVLILSNKNNHKKILHHKIEKGTMVEITSSNEKGYRIYDGTTNKYLGGFKISSSPIRDNLEKGCLNMD